MRLRYALLAGLGTAWVVTLLASVGLLVFGYHVMAVPSGSMEPTITVGSFIVVDQRDRSGGLGDVVTFHAPGWLLGDNTFVKRVVGVGGQTLSCCDDGYLTRDGSKVVEPYVNRADQPDLGPVVVPAGRVWVAGDNRAKSMDSRAHANDPDGGAISLTQVTGTVVHIGTRAEAYGFILRRAAIPGLILGIIVTLVLIGRQRRRAGRSAG